MENMRKLLAFLLILRLTTVNGQGCGQVNVDCLVSKAGVGYVGSLSVTKSGYTCQNWDSQTPNSHHHPLGDHNYCRNPDGEPTVWCYTTNGPRWEVCNVRMCGDCDTITTTTSPKVYLTKTALNKNLEINWLESSRTTLPGDRIILLKNGDYITEIKPIDHAQNYKTDITFDSKTLDLEGGLEQECLGDYTVEWRDQSKEIIAEGCLQTNPKWMQENAIVMKDMIVGNLILTGTKYSGMYSAKQQELTSSTNFPFNSPVLLTDPKCSIWGIACPDHFTSYLNSNPDNLLLQYLFYRIHCEIWINECPAYLNRVGTLSDDDLFANFMSLKNHELISLVSEAKPYLSSMYTKYLRTYLTTFAFPFAMCPIEEMFEEEIGKIVKSYILPRFGSLFDYINDNWVLHHHENILEQLVLGVRYQDIRLLYDGSSDSKFLMGKGCFKGPSLNEGVKQLKMFLKNTKELVFWEINIEETGSNYICGNNSLQWDVGVVEQFVAYLEDELSEWLLRPNDNIIQEKSIWKTQYKNIFNHQKQGRIVLVTKEENFLNKNLFFPTRNAEKIDEVSYHTKINQSISPEYLYKSIADYEKGHLFDFEASLTPSILDFSPTFQSGINNAFDFLGYVLNEIVTIIPNIYKKLPAEVIKQFWELIDTSVENLFAVMDCIFGDITGPLKDFIEDISNFFKQYFGDKEEFFTKLFKPIIAKIEGVTGLIGDVKVRIDYVTALIDKFEITNVGAVGSAFSSGGGGGGGVGDAVVGVVNDVGDAASDFVDSLGRWKRDIDSSRSNTTDNFKMHKDNATIFGIRKKRGITDFVSNLNPKEIFGECKKDLMKIIPTPWTLLTPFTNLALTPMEMLFEKYSQKMKSYTSMVQPYCRYIVQLEIDVLISKVLSEEIIMIPLDLFGISKVKFKSYLQSLLTVIANNQDQLPGLKQFADEVNFNVTQKWRDNSEELSDVFVSLHTYVTGTNMIQENIERLITKIDS